MNTNHLTLGDDLAICERFIDALAKIFATSRQELSEEDSKDLVDAARDLGRATSHGVGNDTDLVLSHVREGRAHHFDLPVSNIPSRVGQSSPRKANEHELDEAAVKGVLDACESIDSWTIVDQVTGAPEFVVDPAGLPLVQIRQVWLVETRVCPPCFVTTEAELRGAIESAPKLMEASAHLVELLARLAKRGPMTKSQSFELGASEEDIDALWVRRWFGNPNLRADHWEVMPLGWRALIALDRLPEGHMLVPIADEA